MGWTPQQLWEATIPEFLLSWRGYQEQQKRADFRAGQIAQILANSNRDPQKTPDPWTAGDFFPSVRETRKPPEPTLEEMKKQLDELERRTTGY